MDIPRVTAEDLRTFGANHFAHGHLPTELFYEYEEEDGLGYYEDGVKRTLTDEQIAIFRNSEIQQIRKEKRRNYERNKKRNALRTLQKRQAADQMTSAFLASNSLATAANAIPVGVPKESPESVPAENAKRTVQPEPEPEDDGSMSAVSTPGVNTPGSSNFDTASTSKPCPEQKGLPRAKKKKVARQRRTDYRDRKREKREEERLAAKAAYEEFTPRRIARELDEKPTEQVELDY